VGSSLDMWENGKVDVILKVVLDFLSSLHILPRSFSVEDEPSPNPAKRLVCRGGHDIGIFKWGWNHLCCHKTTDMCHVREEVRPDLITNLTETGIVEETRVSRVTSDNDLGPEEAGIGMKRVIVNQSCKQTSKTSFFRNKKTLRKTMNSTAWALTNLFSHSVDTAWIQSRRK